MTIDEDMKRYISITAGITTANLTESFDEEYKELGLKKCTEAEFNSSLITLDYFRTTSSY